MLPKRCRSPNIESAWKCLHVLLKILDNTINGHHWNVQTLREWGLGCWRAHMIALGVSFDKIKNTNGWDVFSDAVSDGNAWEVFKVLKLHKCLSESNAFRNEYTITLLHKALMDNEMDVVKLMVELGFDVNTVDCRDRSLLHYAVALKDLDMVQYLLDKGATTDKPLDNFHYVAPYDYACGVGNSEILKAFLDRDSNCQQRHLRYDGPLLRAVINQNYETTKLLLERGAGRNSVNKGGSPLSLAISMRQLNLVKLFIEHGVNPDLAGKLSLHTAARNGDCDIMRILLEHGFDSRSLDNAYSIPLMLAVKSRNRDVVDVLLDHDSDTTFKYNRLAFSMAVLYDGLQGRMYQQFVERGFVLDDKLAAETAFLAVNHGYFRVVEMLLDAGYPIMNFRNEDGDKLIHHTFKEKQYEITRLLLSRGADLHEVNEKGESGVLLAALSEHESIIKTMAMKAHPTLLHEIFLRDKSKIFQRWKLLLKFGVQSNGRDQKDNGVTPLLLAFRDLPIAEAKPLMDLLLEHDANPRLSTYNGTTLLHLLAKSNDNLEIIQRLLKSELNVNAMDSNGKTPLHIAVVNGCDQIVETLLNEGADVNAYDQSKLTPLDLAYDILPRTFVNDGPIALPAAVANYGRLLEHLEKIKAAKMYISANNRKYVNDACTYHQRGFREKCEEEIEYMKRLKFSSSHSVYHYLKNITRKAPRESSRFIHIDLNDYLEEFPIYANLLMLAKKLVMRDYVKVQSQGALCLLSKYNLPEHCTSSIIRNLYITDMSNLMTATNILNDHKCFKVWLEDECKESPNKRPRYSD